MKFRLIIAITAILVIIACTITTILYLLGLIEISNKIVLAPVIIQTIIGLGTILKLIKK